MKTTFLSLFLCLSIQAFSQINYEPGYLINNNGKKMEILILNKDWRDNPTSFKYKQTTTGKVETATIQDVVEFGAGDYLKYKRLQVEIDQSSSEIRNMSRQEEPEFVTETVFLQQLIEGEAELYYYKNGSLERFFILTPKTNLAPLIYKEYLQGNSIATNNRFRQQLLSLVSCGRNSAVQVRNINYREKDFIGFFEEYNKCRQVEYHVFQEEGAGLQFNFSVKAGLDFASLAINNGIYVSGQEIEFEPSLRIGAELEAVLPFNRNKWSVFIEPAYTSHRIEKEHFLAKNVPNHEVDLTVDLKYITFATGMRHYLFLNESSKIFLSAGVSFDTTLKSYIFIDRDERYELDPELKGSKTGAYFNLGLGYDYKSWSAELRYNTPKTITGSSTVLTHYYLDFKSEVNSFSIVLGYSIF